jgi:Ca2+-transporting ATPase
MAVGVCTAILSLAVYVPPLTDDLRVVPPDWVGWMLVMAASLAPLFLGVIISALRASGDGKSRG